MEALTLQAPPSEALINDEEFDLMLGELEAAAPDHSKTPSTCGLHLYCIL
ncbi:MAG: hypothetical protein HOW97_31290 [Catenulispora sp.]|nr:hypothetical protein [Catenulispora sp.]